MNKQTLKIAIKYLAALNELIDAEDAYHALGVTINKLAMNDAYKKFHEIKAETLDDLGVIDLVEIMGKLKELTVLAVHDLKQDFESN